MTMGLSVEKAGGNLEQVEARARHRQTVVAAADAGQREEARPRQPLQLREAAARHPARPGAELEQQRPLRLGSTRHVPPEPAACRPGRLRVSLSHPELVCFRLRQEPPPPAASRPSLQQPYRPPQLRAARPSRIRRPPQSAPAATTSAAASSESFRLLRPSHFGSRVNPAVSSLSFRVGPLAPSSREPPPPLTPGPHHSARGDSGPSGPAAVAPE